MQSALSTKITTIDAPLTKLNATKNNYKDPKRYGWMLGASLPLIHLGAIAAYHFSGQKARPALLTLPFVGHVVVPLLDKLFGDDNSNPPKEAFSNLESDPYYQRVLAAFIPGQLTALIAGAWLAARTPMPLFDQLLLGISAGYVNALGFGVSHEYSHKSDRYSQIMSHLTLLPSGYNHFRIEHPFGHHKRAATPEDPASSRMGESFYEFWPRTVVGGLKSAVEIQKRRMSRRGKGFWAPSNELLVSWLAASIFHASIFVVFGRRVLPYWVTQAVVGFSLFELINYVEHYGLLRAKTASGEYERTLPEHSWNSNSIVGNLFLYHLQRHSDHHAYPTRVYQNLRHFPDAPNYGTGLGYAGILLPALIPGWWRHLMDKKVYNHYKGDLSKANISPAAREQIYKKFNYTPAPVAA